MWIEVEITTVKTHLVQVDMEFKDIQDIPVAKQKAYSIVYDTLSDAPDRMRAAIAVYDDVIRYADEVHRL